jgi:hypothetical protein
VPIANPFSDRSTTCKPRTSACATNSTRPSVSASARLVDLRFFGGLTLAQAAEGLNISLSTADRAWRYARAWLDDAMSRNDPEKK